VQQWRAPLDLFLGTAQDLDDHAVRQLFHKGVVVEEQELEQTGIGKVNDAVFLQPVDNTEDPENTQDTGPEAGTQPSRSYQ